jgi:hypothetical protein
MPDIFRGSFKMLNALSPRQRPLAPYTSGSSAEIGKEIRALPQNICLWAADR